ncbi:CAP domain-containing protein [Actinoplanes sp. NPDC049802]|uniref:CAP domain-containing protein n=1 Tax=Actinoplanes sp. NPDC049802 TaxID=3154742 RepID=UPI0033C5A89A
MRQLLRRFALAALITPAAAGAVMIASPAEAAPAKPTEQALQTEINRLTNVQRTRHGCAATKVNAQLTTAARGHSAWMARTRQFSHTGSGGSNFVKRVKAAGYAKPSSENIAWGYRTASAVVDGWMNSPGHRANILNCKSKTVGVGVVYAANGAPYYTQNFGY